MRHLILLLNRQSALGPFSSKSNVLGADCAGSYTGRQDLVTLSVLINPLQDTHHCLSSLISLFRVDLPPRLWAS